MLKSPFACKTLTFMKRYLNICVSGGKKRTAQLLFFCTRREELLCAACDVSTGGLAQRGKNACLVLLSSLSLGYIL